VDPFSAPYRFELEPPPPNPYASDLVIARAGREPSDVDPNESVVSLLQQAESRFLEEREEALARGRQEASAEIERAEKARQEAVERADAAEMTLSALGDIEARVSQLLAEARSEADRAVTEAERLASLQQEAAQRTAEDRVGELLGEAQGHATELMHMAEREARRLRKEGIARDLQFVDEIETELNEVMFTQLSSLQASRSVLDEVAVAAGDLRRQAAAVEESTAQPTQRTVPVNGWVTAATPGSPPHANGPVSTVPMSPTKSSDEAPALPDAAAQSFDDPFVVLSDESRSTISTLGARHGQEHPVEAANVPDVSVAQPVPPPDIFSSDRSAWGPDDLANLRQAIGVEESGDDLWPPLPEEGVDMHARDLARLNSDTRRTPRNGRGWGIRRGSA
jgi:hypothetical protein